MKVLIVGNGGREHSLALKIGSSPLVDSVYVAKGNAGTYECAKNIDINTRDIDALSSFALSEGIDLVVAGSEDSLALGLENVIREKCAKAGVDIAFFGPSKECAMLESSKSTAKSVMEAASIPTARYASFTDFDEAVKYFSSFRQTYGHDALPVIKADGLAAGKGVFITSSLEEGVSVLASLMKEKSLGTAGAQVVIEERLEGEEISLLAFSDGLAIEVLPIAKDHKRLHDEDAGPNTGGMGAFAPHPKYSYEAACELANIAIKPIIAEMKRRGTPYKGILYAGLMMSKDGPRVLEYNCRFGDPETQVLMELLACDLVPILLACDKGNLSSCLPKWKSGFAITVVLANKGYPDGKVESVELVADELGDEGGVKVIHAGTSRQDGKLVASGGRVLCVTSCKETLEDAQRSVYERIKNITFPHVQYRRDIAR